MSFPDGLTEGPRILGHAIGHAAAMYGNSVADYEDILRAALTHRIPPTARIPQTPRSTGRSYTVRRARELIAEAETLRVNTAAMAGWIGAATEILKELTHDA